MPRPMSRNEAFGDFGLPRKPGRATRHIEVALLVAGLLFGVGAQATTQWIAKVLEYQGALGEPVTLLGDVPLYWPWQAFTWVADLAGSAGGADLARRANNWLLLSGLLATSAGLLVVTSRLRQASNRASQLHGSARWATREDIERAGLLDRSGVILGAWVDRAARVIRTLRSIGPEHILFFATTGAGKGVGCVLPTLLTWPFSTLVLDLKGENHALTSGYRRSLGHNVFKLDPSAEAGDTACFNFLDTIRLGTSREVADAQRIARAFVDPNGELMKASSNGSSHWLATAIGLLTAAILHVLYRDRERSGTARAGMAAILDELADPERSFEQILNDWIAYPHDPRLIQGWRASDGKPTSCHKVVRTAASLLLKKDEKERNAIHSSAVTALEVFQDPLLAANTSRSDFQLEDLMDAEHPTTVYLVLRPDDLKRLGTVARALLEVALRRLMSRMEFVGGRQHGTHRHRMLLLLDELPALGRMDIIAEAIAYMRSYGIKALVIVQNLVQLRNAFGRDEPISVNCAISAAYAPSKVDVETAKILSAMTGVATVIKRNVSKGFAFGAGASKRNSESEQEVSRPLLTPDECTQLPSSVKRGTDIVEGGHMLAFAAGAPAIYGQQFLFFRDKELLRRSQLAPTPAVAATLAPVRAAAAAISEPPRGDPNTTEPEEPSVPPTPSAACEDELDDELMQLGLRTDEGEEGHYDA